MISQDASGIPIVVMSSEQGLRDLLRVELDAHGYVPLETTVSIDAVGEVSPKAIVLDDDVNTTAALAAIRQRSALPIVLLGDEPGSDARIGAARSGVDAYLAKPFDPHDLIVCIDLLLGRKKPSRETGRLALPGDVSVDLRARVITRHGELVMLTPTQWELLLQLAGTPDEAVSSEELLTVVWGSEYRQECRFLRLHINRLREKLQGVNSPETVVADIGTGYRLELAADE